jgi:DNA-binding transcriptional LysR family regulator
VDVQRARAFLALAEELHFGRAAHREHITQPHLSRIIRQVEGEFGATLFDRSTRQVTLTAEGKALIDPARELILHADRMREAVARAHAGESGTVRLGFSGPSVYHLVSRLTRAVNHAKPGLSIELESSQLSRPGLDRVLEGSIDAVIGRWDYLPATVESVVIAREELLVALPPGHPLAARTTITPADLASEPWVALPGGGGATLSMRLHQLGRAGRFVPRIIHTVADSHTMLLLVETGKGIALTFSSVRQNLPTGDIDFRRLSPTTGTVEVRLAWLAGGRTPAIDATLQVAADVFSASASHDVSRS